MVGFVDTLLVKDISKLASRCDVLNVARLLVIGTSENLTEEIQHKHLIVWLIIAQIDLVNYL